MKITNKAGPIPLAVMNESFVRRLHVNAGAMDKASFDCVNFLLFGIRHPDRVNLTNFLLKSASGKGLCLLLQVDSEVQLRVFLVPIIIHVFINVDYFELTRLAYSPQAVIEQPLVEDLSGSHKHFP